jgi:hypothetical protein
LLVRCNTNCVLSLIVAIAPGAALCPGWSHRGKGGIADEDYTEFSP